MTLIVTDIIDQTFLGVSILVLIVNEIRLGIRSVSPDATVQDRGSRVLLTIAVYIGMSLAFALSLSVSSFEITLNPELLFRVGLVLIFAGIILRIYSAHVLGSYFTYTVATRPDQKVVQRGPYRFIRHPSYSAALLSFFGIFLSLTNWLAFLGFVPLLLGYAYRIRIEEAALVKGIGQDYLNYMKRTKRLIPYIL